jgi:hypothetical protein
MQIHVPDIKKKDMKKEPKKMQIYVSDVRVSVANDGSAASPTRARFFCFIFIYFFRHKTK